MRTIVFMLCVLLCGCAEISSPETSATDHVVPHVPTPLHQSASYTHDGDGDGMQGPLDCDDARASVYTGAPELCDYIDNNCDGFTDEPWLLGEPPLYGTVCAITTLNGCVSYGMWACAPDNRTLFCNAIARTPTRERCNGSDDDCNGIADTDRWPELNRECVIELDTCTVYGVWRCDDYTEDVYCTAEDDREDPSACIPTNP